LRAVWSWLRELVELEGDEGPEQAAAALTGAGLEVEAIERLGEGFSGVVVAEVASRRKHPKADKLSLVEVRDAEGGSLTEVVCGAPNVPGPGGRVLWARPGAVLPNGMEIGKRAIKGVESAGMLCSEVELEIGDDGDGIVVLDGAQAGAAALGAQAQDALALREVVFDISVPANRGDALGHYGLARELAALLGGKLRRPKLDLSEVMSDRDVAESVEVRIEDEEGCPRYVARLLDGVRWGASPRWMQSRLRAVGVRPLGNLIDVTNYVMFELGQPLHAFDADLLEGGIVVRAAQAGERITTLDDVDRPLEPSDLVICDRRGPIALAGVMGGARTEVSERTTRVLLESAHFAPQRIRRTARRVNLHSESSHRFERSVDPNGADQASARAARLLAETSGGRVLRGAVDAYVRPRGARVVALRASRAEALTGVKLDRHQMAALLAKLDLTVEADPDGDTLQVSCPTFRPDLLREVDLIEEVLRLHGFDAVPASLPATQAPPSLPRDPRPRAAQAALVAAGMCETVSFGFTSAERVAALGLADDDPRTRPLALRNPMSAEQGVMRTSLLPNLLAAAARNLNAGVGDVALFEIGSVFFPRPAGDRDDGLADEPARVAGVLAGRRPGWLGAGDELDFFDLKGVVEPLLEALGASASARFDQVSHAPWHPGVGARIMFGDEGDDQEIGELGEVHPRVREASGIETRCFGFEILLDRIPPAVPAAMQPIPRFPSISRDISFFVAADVPAARVRGLLEGADEPLVESVAVLEDYRDPERVPAGKKGMLWSITYRSPDRTLTDEEVDRVHDGIATRLLQALGAERR
jgi:phenylalanyl-tRNA synthetase beta chain